MGHWLWILVACRDGDQVALETETGTELELCETDLWCADSGCPTFEEYCDGAPCPTPEELDDNVGCVDLGRSCEWRVVSCQSTDCHDGSLSWFDQSGALVAMYYWIDVPVYCDGTAWEVWAGAPIPSECQPGGCSWY